ncbi:hypothetical protein SUGI_0211440 [Cryptomeria japonica]|nr:hypothetical protein SUGI_0211440 [Cryptomeria japonica]
MGGGSPSPSPSPVGSPRGHNIEGDLTNAFNNCRIQPSDPGSSATAAAAAVLTNCGIMDLLKSSTDTMSISKSSTDMEERKKCTGSAIAII